MVKDSYSEKEMKEFINKFDKEQKREDERLSNKLKVNELLNKYSSSISSVISHSGTDIFNAEVYIIGDIHTEKKPLLFLTEIVNLLKPEILLNESGLSADYKNVPFSYSELLSFYKLDDLKDQLIKNMNLKSMNEILIKEISSYVSAEDRDLFESINYLRKKDIDDIEKNVDLSNLELILNKKIDFLSQSLCLEQDDRSLSYFEYFLIKTAYEKVVEQETSELNRERYLSIRGLFNLVLNLYSKESFIDRTCQHNDLLVTCRNNGTILYNADDSVAKDELLRWLKNGESVSNNSNINYRREITMAENVISRVTNYKTIVVFVGKDHIQKSYLIGEKTFNSKSTFISTLDDSNIGYAAISFEMDNKEDFILNDVKSELYDKKLKNEELD